MTFPARVLLSLLLMPSPAGLAAEIDGLLQLAAEGRLDDPPVIGQQAGRLLADARSTGFVRNFTLQWLSLGKMRTLPINRDLFPRFLCYVPLGERAGTEELYRPTIRDHMLEETVGFVGESAEHASSMEAVKACLLKDRKEDVAANLLRRLLTYGLGREPTYRDRFAVESLLNYLKMDGLGMRDMIVSVCRSPLFLETETLPNHER
jgi:hypothetical protein